MQNDVLDAIGRAAVASPAFDDNSTIVWHAGEPFVLRPDWYRAAQARIEATARRPIERQAFQTNATIISDRWIEFLREPNITVGVSLDGPANIHDRRRKNRRGGGTHAAVMRGIAKLRSAGIPFHTISVVTSASIAQPEEMAEALIATGAYSIGLNVEEVEGVNSQSSLFEVGEDAYRRFLERFISTVERADNPPRVREVDRFYEMLATGATGKWMRHQENAPGAIVTVAVDGSVSTFSPELIGTSSTRYEDFRFGNIRRMRDVSEIFLGVAFRRAHRDISVGVNACRAHCPWFDACGGGSPSNKFGETGRLDTGETRHCRLAVKVTNDVLLRRVEVTDRIAS